MTDYDTIDSRLMQLEIKASFSEDLLDRLEQIVTRQQHQLDRLTHAVQQLQQASASESASPALRFWRDDLPPHY